MWNKDEEWDENGLQPSADWKKGSMDEHGEDVVCANDTACVFGINKNGDNGEGREEDGDGGGELSQSRGDGHGNKQCTRGVFVGLSRGVSRPPPCSFSKVDKSRVIKEKGCKDDFENALLNSCVVSVVLQPPFSSFASSKQDELASIASILQSCVFCFLRGGEEGECNKLEFVS